MRPDTACPQHARRMATYKYRLAQRDSKISRAGPANGDAWLAPCPNRETGSRRSSAGRLGWQGGPATRRRRTLRLVRDAIRSRSHAVGHRDHLSRTHRRTTRGSSGENRSSPAVAPTGRARAATASCRGTAIVVRMVAHGAARRHRDPGHHGPVCPCSNHGRNLPSVRRKGERRSVVGHTAFALQPRSSASCGVLCGESRYSPRRTPSSAEAVAANSYGWATR
jgi:hypothetical protein